MSKLIDIVVGTRPNFIKVAAIIKELVNQSISMPDIKFRLIHTSQHYDVQMCGIFFKELNLPHPDINLNIGNVEQKQQIPTIIERYSNVLSESRPDMVIVSGDVNSTVACAIATKKTDPTIILAHVEAGLRCGENNMPEEINRILTDSISDIFFTASHKASDILIKEGKNPDKVIFVGNTMIDTLKDNINKFIQPECWKSLDLQEKGYYILTLHRQSNISNKETLQTLLNNIAINASDVKVVFPVHPHTLKQIAAYGIQVPKEIMMIDALGYLEFNYLVKYAAAVITDSGGISEETTVMNIPCITLRTTTERPETCEIGTNMLIGKNANLMQYAFKMLKTNQWVKGSIPEKWDGNAAKRIVKTLPLILYANDNVNIQEHASVNKKVYTFFNEKVIYN